jgi:hypothetical protein
LRRELERELKWAREEIDKQRTSHVKVTANLDGTGALKKEKFWAEADIPFSIDLENISDDRAITIHAIYIYSTAQWKLYQDNKECASTEADEQFAVQGFKRRHFVQPPLQFLQKRAWAQVKFNARGTLATAFKGEQLQETYHVRGRSVMRIVTADGNFDHNISIDVEVNDIPF